MRGQNRGESGSVGAVTHGVHAASKILNELGTRGIDGRTRVAREIAEWRQALVRDLGGEEEVSTAQLAIIEQACRIRIIIDVMDGWLFGEGSRIVDAEGKAHDLLTLRRQYARTLLDILRTLGLQQRRSMGRKLDGSTQTDGDPNDLAAQIRENPQALDAYYDLVEALQSTGDH